MSDYTYSNTWVNKDALASGVAGKRVSATEFHTEFGLIQTAVNTKADKAAPTFTGTVTIDGSGTLALGTGKVSGTISGGTFS
jgi:hypothetical protein